MINHSLCENYNKCHINKSKAGRINYQHEEFHLWAYTHGNKILTALRHVDFVVYRSAEYTVKLSHNSVSDQ